MIDDKELIRRALLGDQEAQKQCTEKGIVLPCPICHGKIEQSLTGNRFICKQCGFVFYAPISGNYGTDEYINIVHRFNIRSAPQIGRCGECKIKEKAAVNDKGFLICPVSGMEITDNDFCSYFEPREE